MQVVFMPSLVKALPYVAVLALSAPMLESMPAQAYPLNPWGGLTAKGGLAMTPFLYYYPTTLTFSPYLYLGYGLNENVDFIGGVGGTWDATLDPSEGVSLELATLYGRYFVNESVAVVGHVTYYPDGSLEVAPEVHFVKSWDKVALTANVGYFPSIMGEGGGFDPGAVRVWLAPEYNFSEQCSVFLEINPALALTGDAPLSVQLVPGVGFSLDAEQSHVFSVGLQLNLAPGEAFSSDSVSLGMWYSHTIGGE